MDAKALRAALGSFATGVTIVTTCHNGRNVGLTANSFNSVSLDPPLVLWSLAKKSSNIDAFTNTGAFAVHILSAEQEDLSNRFATSGIDKFADLDFEVGEANVPLLRECAARFECQIAYRYDGGDHVIFVGEVLNLDHSAKEPLLFHQGKYARKTGTDQRGAEETRRDLNYLIARCYFRMTDEVRVEAQKSGISQIDHYALSVLLQSGPSTLEAVNSILSSSGSIWLSQNQKSLLDRGLIKHTDDGLIELTKAGRETMIELFALAKATEVQALGGFEDHELDTLRTLLSKLLANLGSQTARGADKHLEVMSALQADQS